MMQAHSHLLKNDVVGFMAGYQINRNKENSKTFVITESYPAETLECANTVNLKEKNIEICPESA